FGYQRGQADLRKARRAARRITGLLAARDSHFDLEEALPEVRDLNDQQWGFMEREIRAIAAKAPGGPDALFLRMGLGFWRSGKNLMESIGSYMEKDAYDQFYREGDAVPEAYLQSGPKYLVDQMALDGGIFTSGSVRLTAEQAREANQYARGVRR